jgi:hypothetical protein
MVLSSGMWRCVDLVWTDISEERIASIFRAEKSVSKELACAGGDNVPPKCRFTQNLHGATSQKTEFFVEYVYQMNVCLRRLDFSPPEWV